MSYKIIHTKSKNNENKSTFTTVRHFKHTESPKCSTVIFIDESKEVEKHESKNKNNKTKQCSKTSVEASKSENELLDKISYLKEIPVKEKSKFTMTNFDGVVEKVADQGQIG